MLTSRRRFDQDTGKYFILRDIATTVLPSPRSDDDAGSPRQPVETRETSLSSVLANGRLKSQHDLRVSGKMNFCDRQAFAELVDNENLRCDSPKSLMKRATARMYLPRNDKFEGYCQFPRPRLPPETQREDTFRTKHKRGQIYIGAEREKATMPEVEFKQLQLQKK